MNEKINDRLDSIDYKLIDLDVKLNKILNLLEQDVQPNCKKMSSHIDFVDNVYDNVKNPLDYLCNKINNLTGNTEAKTLENVKK